MRLNAGIERYLLDLNPHLLITRLLVLLKMGMEVLLVLDL
ncbi:hypothetical protein BOVAC16_4399 [Bacteroides ovatus]|nr:hypothetical protein BOVAC16_4399 [Bacteroides ovatus]